MSEIVSMYFITDENTLSGFVLIENRVCNIQTRFFTVVFYHIVVQLFRC